MPLALRRAGVSCPWCESGRRPPRPELLSGGHPKVAAEQSGDEVVLLVRSGGGLFAWIWTGASLLLLGVFAAAVLLGAELHINGRLIREPGPEHYAVFLLVPALFALGGGATLAARRRITLSPSSVRSELLLLPRVGWSERLAVTGPVNPFLAHRGASMNNRPVEAVVVSSGGEEISFGSFMGEDLKAYLVAVIADYYGTDDPAGAPFITGQDGSGR